MAGLKRFSAAMLVAVVAGGIMTVHSAQVAVFADSTVVAGPGFKVEKKRGWFGREKTVYTDALGNRIEKKKGLFGRKKTQTKLFGSEMVRNGQNVKVLGPNGKPLVTKKRRWFGGQETQVDGNGIYDAVKGIFNQP